MSAKYKHTTCAAIKLSRRKTRIPLSVRSRKCRQRPQSPRDAAGIILDHVPPELWAPLVAKAPRRQAIGRLCPVSQAFYDVFFPLLYATATENPPLTDDKAAGLIETISEACTPHPAFLVRSLVFPYWTFTLGTLQKIDPQACLAALGRLFDPRGADAPFGEWRFVHLSGECTTVARTHSGPSSHPRFLRIPNLEKIDFFVSFSDNEFEKSRPSYYALGADLKSLPSFPPLLLTLKLKLAIYWTRIASQSGDTLVDVLTRVNEIQFPALSALELVTQTSYLLIASRL
ncbi:hypothetical protein DFH09DRAFT_1069027 [Mycena vulgaris]|nr:hypothetical protein DFH09DRAFT_1069027 [Mycena vulgaris]